MSQSTNKGLVSSLYEAEAEEKRALDAARKHDWAKSQECFIRAIEMRKAIAGANDGHVGILLHKLGQSFLSTDVEKAMKAFAEAVSVLEKAYYAGHASIAPVLADQAECLIGQKKFAEAEPILKRALDINDKTLVNDHRTNLEGLRKLADVYRKLDKPAEAAALLQKALKFVDTPLGPSEEFRYEFALACIDQKNDVQAEEQLLQAIEGFRYRNSYDRLVEAYRQYGAVLKRASKNSESKAALELADHYAAMPASVGSPRDIFPSTLLR